MLVCGENAALSSNSLGTNGLRRKDFIEEILAICRQEENGVFRGKIGISGQSLKLAQAAGFRREAIIAARETQKVRQKVRENSQQTLETVRSYCCWQIIDSNAATPIPALPQAESGRRRRDRARWWV